MKRLARVDVVVAPAVDRLSLDTTDLLVIAREMQRSVARSYNVSQSTISRLTT
jgi:hypothetical protein